MAKTAKKSNTKVFVGIGIGVLVFLVAVVALLLGGANGKKTYEVGTNLDPGEYVLTGVGKYTIGGKELADGYGYYGVCSQEDCVGSSIVMNGNIFGKAYVILEKGQFLQTKNMEVEKVTDYKANLATSLNFNYSFNIGSDYYKVGKDLAAGAYEISGTDFYYAICSRPTCDAFLDHGEINNEIIDNYYAQGKETVEVTLENGQYFVVSPSDKPFTMVKK